MDFFFLFYFRISPSIDWTLQDARHLTAPARGRVRVGVECPAAWLRLIGRPAVVNTIREANKIHSKIGGRSRFTPTFSMFILGADFASHATPLNSCILAPLEVEVETIFFPGESYFFLLVVS